MGMTVSVSKGRTAILHDVRKEISANVDTDLIMDNEIFIDELAQYKYDLVAYTDAHFQPYIDQFNEGKKPSRQIKESYTEHLAKENDKLIKKAEENKKNGVKASVRKPTQLAHEYVLQFGNRENNSTLQMDGETEKAYKERMKGNKEGLRKALEDLQEKYPHAHVLLATYHQDEPNGTPHMHVLVQFEGEDYANGKGLSHRISISKALELDGLERSGNRGDYAINRWTNSVKEDILAPQLKLYLNEDREILDDKRKHEDIVFFREKAKAEAEALKAERDLTKAEAEALKAERNLTKETHNNLDSEIDRQKEYVKALKEGGSFTNEQGERERIDYYDSVAHMEFTREQLKENVEAYEKGGFFYDWEKQEAHSIPDGGIAKLVKDAEETAASITKNANLKAEKLVDGLETYETNERRRIDDAMKEYEKEQKDSIKEKLKEQRGQIEKNNETVTDQFEHIKKNYTTLADQETDISQRTERIRELDGQINGKEKEIQALNEIGSKMDVQELNIHSEQVGGFLSKREVTVIEDISPVELQKVFQRANIGADIQNAVKQAQTAAQGIINQAQEQAGTMLAQNQALIDQAKEASAKNKQRKAELDRLENTIKEKNAELLQQNKQLSSENAKLTSDIVGLTEERNALLRDKKFILDTFDELEAKNKDLNAKVEAKTAFIDAELSPDQLKEMMDDSTVHNIAMTAALDTCKQLHDKGLLTTSPEMAFNKIDQKRIRDRLKDLIPDFVQKVKDHMIEMAERVISHHRTR